jgi:hypothetical protein
MLTVKVVTKTDEVVFEAKQVRKTRFNEPLASAIIGHVYIDVEDGQITYDVREAAPADGSDDQVIYVMNRQGATVATYYI